MGTIMAVPLDRVRPYAGQPRAHFDEKALEELAESIKAHGQHVPAWVVEVGAAPVHSAGEPAPRMEAVYELVAGERRWRACRMAGVPTLLCEVRAYPDERARYVASVMENFGRKDCTAMEAARSVGRILADSGGDHRAAASVFARSEAWVRQMDSLNRLAPEVAAMLEPPNPRLTTQTGVALANLRPEVQASLAREIAARSLRHSAALALVRNTVTDDQRVSRRGRGRRKPSADFDLLKRLLDSLGGQTEAVKGMGPERLRAMFAHRDPRVKDAVRALLAKRARELEDLRGMMS